MQYRSMGQSGLLIPNMILGTATFGGTTEFFKNWGTTGVDEASRLVDIGIEHGANMFDTADAYSDGAAEEILGRAIAGKRSKVLIATKTGMRMGEGPNDQGTSRSRILAACDASLRRLGTDVIDLYQLHAFDALTPIDEMLRALDDLLRAGKIRYFGVSNYSGWHLMKMIAAARENHLPAPVTHQAYYSLAGRDFEHELMPLGVDQNIGTLVWSPLAGARLTGKIGRHKAAPPESRGADPAVGEAPMERVFSITDVLEAMSGETGHSIAQLALAWVLGRPTVSALVIGARDEAQLTQNLAASSLTLSPEQVARLDKASKTPFPYPYWHQRFSARERIPALVPDWDL